MKTKFYIVCLLIILSLHTGCLYAVRYDGPYHGKVVDEQTREPIEGAVVLGWWNVHHFGLGGGYSEYYDARETVTDKSGDFTIPGKGLRVLSSLEPMSFVIYKAGYAYYKGTWDTLKTDMNSVKVIKWEDDMPFIPIRKLTDADRKKTVTFPPAPPAEASLNKVRLMLMEMNKEAIERGLEPINIWRGEKIWQK